MKTMMHRIRVNRGGETIPIGRGVVGIMINENIGTGLRVIGVGNVCVARVRSVMSRVREGRGTLGIDQRSAVDGETSARTTERAVGETETTIGTPAGGTESTIETPGGTESTIGNPAGGTETTTSTIGMTGIGTTTDDARAAPAIPDTDVEPSTPGYSNYRLYVLFIFY